MNNNCGHRPSHNLFSLLDAIESAGFTNIVRAESASSGDRITFFVDDVCVISVEDLGHGAYLVIDEGGENDPKEYSLLAPVAAVVASRLAYVVRWAEERPHAAAGALRAIVDYCQPPALKAEGLLRAPSVKLMAAAREALNQI